MVKLALSRKLCGLLIGHKGQTVRDFITDSGASIRVQSLSELTPSDPERTITVSGARDQVLRAVALILNTLSQHDEYVGYMETTMHLADNQGVILPPRSTTTRNALSSVRACLTLYLPDDDIGAILGRKGQNLVDIQQVRRAGGRRRRARRPVCACTATANERKLASKTRSIQSLCCRYTPPHATPFRPALPRTRSPMHARNTNR